MDGKNWVIIIINMIGGGGGLVSAFLMVLAIVFCVGLLTGSNDSWTLMSQVFLPYCILPIVFLGLALYFLFAKRK